MVNKRIGLLVVLLAGLVLSSGCERTRTSQLAYRGLGQVQNDKPSKLEALYQVNIVPKPLKAANPEGPRARDYYENVRLLGDYSKSEFARTMSSIKSWVAPEQGCGYCHNAPNYADDSKYTKRVAREMIKMTRRINTQWSAHVGKTGVTCYTCHRGQPVPAKLWYSPTATDLHGITATKSPMRLPTASAGTTGLPNDALQAFLLDNKEIRVIGTSALQSGNHRSIKQAKYTYAMMMVMAESLGVNCDYCHNTRAFYSWEQSSPQRATAWYGIRMVRDLNNNIMVPLTSTFPDYRLGPTGDAPKIYCATCHQGVFKPLYGVSMVKDFPELIAPKTADYVEGPKPGSPYINDYTGGAAGAAAMQGDAPDAAPATPAPAESKALPPGQKSTSVAAPEKTSAANAPPGAKLALADRHPG